MHTVSFTFFNSYTHSNYFRIRIGIIGRWQQSALRDVHSLHAASSHFIEKNSVVNSILFRPSSSILLHKRLFAHPRQKGMKSRWEKEPPFVGCFAVCAVLFPPTGLKSQTTPVFNISIIEDKKRPFLSKPPSFHMACTRGWQSWYPRKGLACIHSSPYPDSIFPEEGVPY